METKDLIWECIWDIRNTLSRDDVTSIPRYQLEQLIIRVNDRLEQSVEGDIPWWDKPDPDELANFQIELISVR